MSRKELIQGFINQHQWKVYAVILSGTLVSLLNVVIPLSIGGFFELAFHEGGSKSQLLQLLGLRFETLNHFFGTFFCLVLLRGLFGFGEFYLAGTTKEKLSAYLREALFRVQLQHTMESFHSRSISKYLVRYGNDMGAVQNYFVKGRWKWIADLVFFAVAFALLITMSPVAGVIVMSAFGLAAA
ncbi:MAG: ABC transporter transmembrane domain-containing protein, partial [Flavobacteriales bacterium]